MSPPPSHIMRRLLALWESASEDTKVLGRRWYPEAGAWCSQLATQTGYSRATVCGVVAALSPRLHWTANRRAARALLIGHTPTGVLSASLVKARRILNGEPPTNVLRGPKTRAFHLALLGYRWVAVVDVWTARAAGLRSLSRRAYRLVATSLRQLAECIGVTTTTLQATLWVAARGRA